MPNNNDETQLQPSSEETVLVEKGDEIDLDLADMSIAEKNVPLDWNIGDVILDLYEVKPVDEYDMAFHAGGFGKVYKVHHKTWNMDLAVKAPHAHTFTTQSQKDNYIKECQSWIELGMHPNIATCYYVRELGGVPRIFAEYVTQGSLKDWIESGRLYEGDSEMDVLKHILDIAIQFAWGLHYAHEKGLIHQDVKPQNVMMAEKGEVKVVDFGLARAKAFGGMLDSNGELDQSVMVTSAGGYTPAYCSPEQIGGNKLTRRTDMWSWGVSVMELFTGGVTWESGALAAQSLESFLEHNGEEEDIPAMPRGVVELLKQCFEKDEVNRPKTMLGVANQLIDLYEMECNEKYLRMWQEGVSDTPDVLNNYALSFMDLGDHPRAEALWKKALELNSQHMESVYNSGVLLWRTGRISDLELIEKIQNIKSTHKNSWEFYYLLGMIHLERSAAETAIEAFEEALKKSDESEVVSTALTIARKGKNSWSRHLQTLTGAKQEGYRVAITPDGKTILSVNEEHQILLWDVNNAQSISAFNGPKSSIYAIKITNDGRYAVTSNGDHTLKYWDITKRTYILSMSGHKAEITAMDISSDGCFAVSVSADRTLIIFDIKNNMILKTIKLEEPWVGCVALSSDMKYILYSGYYKIYLLEFSTGKCLHVFEGHTRTVRAIVITKDSRYAVSAGDDGCLKLWEIVTGNCLRIYKGSKHPVSALALSPDHQYILSGENDNYSRDNRMLRFDIFTGQCYTLLDHETAFNKGAGALVLSYDGHYAASKGVGPNIQIWWIANSDFKAMWHFSKPSSASEEVVKEALYKNYLNQADAFLSQEKFYEAAKLVVKAWTLPGNQRLKEVLDSWAKIYQYLPKGDFGRAWELKNAEDHMDRFSVRTDEPIKIKMDSIYDDLEVKLTDLKKNNCLWDFKVENTDLLAVKLKINGRYLVRASDRLINLHDLTTGQLLQTFEGHKATVTATLLTPNESSVISGGKDKTVKIWDVRTGKCVHTLKGHTGDVSCLSSSPDGRYIYSGSGDGTILKWEIGTGKAVRIFYGYANFSVVSLAVSGDGRWLISCQSTVLILWNVETGEIIREFKGHKDYVNTMVITPDGNYMLSGSGVVSGLDNTIKLWEISTGKCVNTFEGHHYGVDTILISVDGRYILSKNSYGEIKMWELIWNIEEHEKSDWAEGAEPYLKNFLAIHQSEKRKGFLKPQVSIEWNEEDFQNLMTELGYRGFGYLSAEGITQKLEELKNRLE